MNFASTKLSKALNQSKHVHRNLHISGVISSDHSRTYYDELGLDSESTSEEIKQAFYALSKENHPDLNQNDPDSLKRFQAINEAYNTLSNPKLRRLYDTGKLGRTTSVADREISKHRFKGEAFYKSRTHFRDEYGSEDHRGKHTVLDNWVTDHRRKNFDKRQHYLNSRRADPGTRRRIYQENMGQIRAQTSGKAKFVFGSIVILMVFLRYLA